jgi:hypothetical protein
MQAFNSGTHGSARTSTAPGASVNTTGSASAPPSIWTRVGSDAVLDTATPNTCCELTQLPVTVG